MSQPSRRVSRVVAATLVAALSASLAACSGDDDAAPKHPASSPSSSAPAAVAAPVTFGTLTGVLPGAKREAVASEVQKVVDGWIDAAYVGGDYPRTDFAGSWPGFTHGAQLQARRDAALMSNSDIGAKIDDVELTRRVLRLDVLSRKGHPVGVTARVLATFHTTGDLTEDVELRARLYLSHGPQGQWQVFGYNVSKGTA